MIQLLVMARLLLVAAFALAAGCAGEAPLGEDHLEGDPEVSSEREIHGRTLTLGRYVRVTATALNLRDAPGTQAAVLTTMPCGTRAAVLDGPSTTPVPDWWQLDHAGTIGWASGRYLVDEADYDAAICGGDAMPTDVAAIFERARAGVGYSYFWGHGAWREDGTQRGTCTGSCPSCSHTGAYGADCSGFIAKVWQVPRPSALDDDQHPYTTQNFYNDQTHWRPVQRSTMQPADAVVRRQDGAGHIALVEKTDDPFGQVWLYEARSCGVGVVHNLRSVDTSYIVIRRHDL